MQLSRRLPAKRSQGQVGTGVVTRYVTLAPRGKGKWNMPAAGSGKRVHEFEDAAAAAGTQIDLYEVFLAEMFKRSQMADRQIDDMNVVPNSGPVWCTVIIAENADV